MSNEERAPGWLGYIGDYSTQLYRYYFLKHHYKDPVINQPVFHGKQGTGFFSWLTSARRQVDGFTSLRRVSKGQILAGRSFRPRVLGLWFDS